MKTLKGTKLYSILTGTCPVCHIGKMYVDSNPYHLDQTLKMYKHCTHCNTKFKLEPSFFYGAMYVSYALGVALAIAIFIICYYFIGISRTATFIVIILSMIILLPVILRTSRNIWINIFLNFDERVSN